MNTSAEPDWQEEFDHRAAILEYDGGFSRRDAEEEAGYWVDGQKRDWERRYAKVPVVDMSDG